LIRTGTAWWRLEEGWDPCWAVTGAVLSCPGPTELKGGFQEGFLCGQE